MFELVQYALDTMCKNLDNQYDNVQIEEAQKAEEAINSYRSELREKHIREVNSRDYSYLAGVSYSGLFALSEKIGDHLINITEAIVEFKFKYN